MEKLLSFKNPVLTINGTGTLIPRKDGIESIEKITEGKLDFIALDELSMNAGILHIIMIFGYRKSAEAHFSIEVEVYCPKLKCLFCMQGLNTFGICAVFTSCNCSHCHRTVLVYLKMLIKLVWSFL